MRKRLRITAKILLTLIILWVVGDFVHSRLVNHWINEWEATVEREPNGVLQGCDAYITGEGDSALLLVHGINASPRHYDKMAPALAKAGFTCRVMRLPGFAEPIPRYAESTSADWREAVSRELAALRASYDRVGIVAHSLGGAVTIDQLIEEPDSADFVVLMAPAVAVSNERSPLLSTRAWHEVGNVAFLFTTILHSPFEMDCHDPAHRDHPGRSPFASIKLIDQLFELMDRNWERVDRFQTPVLVVLSKEDQVTDWRAAERFYQQVPADPKEILFLENSGHSIPLDYDWEKATAAIVEFAGKFDVEAENSP